MKLQEAVGDNSRSCMTKDRWRKKVADARLSIRVGGIDELYVGQDNGASDCSFTKPSNCATESNARAGTGGAVDEAL